ncbi:hypothetical protein EJB05_40431 [Eragrostis curvula]|uniref:Cyclin-like domain-containing protein n=1 Tax=Eragrostis curvula TaxID=38414 RepID=A0A5J9TR81_9POAL|nr:hypothetical protein EJB05_40431 [Eragrostis curvula]
MLYCDHCADYCPTIKDPDKGYICCGRCGKVLDQEIYTDEPTFIKDSSGQSRLAGNILNSIESGYSLSHERTLEKGKDEISQIVSNLHVGGGDTIIEKAHRFYKTGRKPSGLCGAALYIAALSHGFNYTKADIVSVVHVCEATLTKRLIEFENTDSGSLTIEEFLAKADEISEEPVPKLSPKSGEILCKHKDRGAEHFAHGLCEKCFNKFTELSGGLEGGADPPAFQRAEKQRLEAEKNSEEVAGVKEIALGEKTCATQNSDVENSISPPEKDLTPSFNQDTSGEKILTSTSPEITNDSVPSKDLECGDEKGKGDDDPESLSDIDDVEVDWYLHNEEETQYKKIIWEEMNKEYLEEQAAKEALAAELAARGVAMEDGKKKKRKRNEDAKTPLSAETPAEATCNMLKRKGLGSKINVEAVGGLYNTKDEDGSGNKKEEMDFEGGYAQDDNGDAETFDYGYDYADQKYDGYDNDGGEADDIFDFL